MPRPIDMPIGERERLWRSVRPDQLLDDGRPAPDAMDGEWTSVVREKYATSCRDALSSERPSQSVVVETTRERLPERFVTNGVAYMIWPQDAPNDADSAHAEIRFARESVGVTEPRAPSSRAAKTQFKMLVANSMLVVML